MNVPQAASQRHRRRSDTLLLIMAATATSFVLFGFLVSTPTEIVSGLIDIQFVRDTLITDYIGVGGMGAAFVNSGLLTLIAAAFFYFFKADVGGSAIASLSLVLGFSLFGKTFLMYGPL